MMMVNAHKRWKGSLLMMIVNAHRRWTNSLAAGQHHFSQLAILTATNNHHCSQLAILTATNNHHCSQLAILTATNNHHCSQLAILTATNNHHCSQLAILTATNNRFKRPVTELYSLFNWACCSPAPCALQADSLHRCRRRPDLCGWQHVTIQHC